MKASWERTQHFKFWVIKELSPYRVWWIWCIIWSFSDYILDSCICSIYFKYSCSFSSDKTFSDFVRREDLSYSFSFAVWRDDWKKSTEYKMKHVFFFYEFDKKSFLYQKIIFIKSSKRQTWWNAFAFQIPQKSILQYYYFKSKLIKKVSVFILN
jgi:hypothetical protein